MSRTLVVTAVLAAALGSATTVWLGATEPSQSEPRLARAPDADVVAPARRRGRSGPNLRPLIEQEEARALPLLHGRAQVEAYLDRLVMRARTQGYVSAVEVEPGMTAIFGLRPELPEEEVLAMADDFDARMQALTAELGGRPAQTPPDLDEALARVVAADDDPLGRRDAIDDVVEALEDLDEPERLEAEARLDEALQGAERPPAEDLDALREAMDFAVEPGERERAVRRYVEAVENLPREEAEALLAEVERGELPGASLL